MPSKPESRSGNGPEKGGQAGPESWSRNDFEHGTGRAYPVPDAGHAVYCVYNLSRQRFLGVEVEAGDFTPSGLELRLQTLNAGKGRPLWLVPFRGISPASVRMPCDLVYLDGDCRAIDVVESFPIFQAPSSSRPASSVLVLPARSLDATGLRAGDRLLIRPPAEMKLLLEQETGLEAFEEEDRKPDRARGRAGPQLVTTQVSRRNDLSDSETGISAGENSEASSAEPDAGNDLEPEAAGKAANEGAPRARKKNWLQRWFSPEPDDKRCSPREPDPDLAAFFFTGGAPLPHPVRDISESGVYVLTGERWYPGTILRLTLTAQRAAAASRSYTVNAVVVRWGNDGVGFHFVFQDKKDRRRAAGSARSGEWEVANADSFREFLRAVRGSEA